jgi:thioredoxin reductase
MGRAAAYSLLRGTEREGGHERLVRQLGLALDEQGFVRVDAHKATSVPGIHAAGDLTTMLQGALVAAAEGAMAGCMMNHGLTMESVALGG